MTSVEFAAAVKAVNAGFWAEEFFSSGDDGFDVCVAAVQRGHAGHQACVYVKIAWIELDNLRVPSGSIQGRLEKARADVLEHVEKWAAENPRPGQADG